MVKDVAVIADQDFDAVLESQALDSRVSLGLLLFGQRQTDPITLVVHDPTDGALTPATPDLQHRGAWFDVCRCQNCIQLAELGVVQLIPLRQGGAWGQEAEGRFQKWLPKRSPDWLGSKVWRLQIG